MIVSRKSDRIQVLFLNLLRVKKREQRARHVLETKQELCWQEVLSYRGFFIFNSGRWEKYIKTTYKSYFSKNILDDSYGIEHTYLPGGAYTFRMRNVTYAGTRQHGGTGALVSPQASYAKFVDKLFVIVKGFLYRY